MRSCLFLLLILLVPSDIRAQRTFYGRPAEEDYMNYGRYEYKPYRRDIEVDRRYDYFGNFLMEGFLAFGLDERRPGKSRILKDDTYISWFNKLIVSKDHYGRWFYALTVGDEIRTLFTPLTFYQSGFNGIRWDMALPKNKVTFLASRGFEGSLFPRSKAFSTPVRPMSSTTRSTIVDEDNPVYTFGGHWQTQVGDILTFGATMINQHQMRTRGTGTEEFLRGTVPYPEMLPPGALIVRFSDDSPEDGEDGAAVFGVWVTLNGAVGSRDTTISNDPTVLGYDPSFRPKIVGGRPVGAHIEANGEDAMEYYFDLPDAFTPRRATIRAIVANDYRISVSQEHDFFRVLTDRFETRQTPYYTMVRASGNVGDLSNKREVQFEYGLHTGHTLYGCNFEAHLVGLKIRGEYVRNELYRKFPILSGSSSSRHADAWFLDVEKKLGPASAGAEIFRVESEYGGGYDSRRGGAVLYTDKAGDTQDQAVSSEFPLVDDNDDNDRYADDNIRDFPGGGEPESGVFPGLDEDHDNVPDDDRNSNGVPDYEEPFLLYFSDPQDFVYGIDFNNNGIIDVRENDDRPDYPYDRDLKGIHGFAALSPIQDMEFAFGAYRMEQIMGGGTATSKYVRFSYLYSFPKIGELEIAHDSKRVRDTIADPAFVFRAGEDNSPLNPPDPDPMVMTDSWVHTSFLEARYAQIPGMNVINNVQLIRNRQYPDASVHRTKEHLLNTITTVNKAEYRWAWGKLEVMPMVKHLFKKVTRTGRSRPLEHWRQVAPILRVNYPVTSKTTLQFGQQGIRLSFLKRGEDLLTFHFTDQVDPSRTFTATDFVMMLSILSDYLGHKISSNVGVQRRVEEYEDETVARTRNATFSRFFINVVVGF